MPAPQPGPPPEMPPHGSSDPSSPDYNPERDAWEDRVGPAKAQEIKTNWQRWAAAEDDYIRDQIGIGGKNLEEVTNENGEFYQNAPEKGASAFARWTPEEVANVRKNAMQRLLGWGSYTPASDGGYESSWGNAGDLGSGLHNKTYRDAGGNITRVEDLNPDYGGAFGANAFGTGGAYGGVNPAGNGQQQTQAYRPYLKTDNYAFDRGWSEYLGRTDTSPTKKKPVASDNPYGDIRQGGVNDPYNLPGRSTGYIPGLSPNA